MTDVDLRAEVQLLRKRLAFLEIATGYFVPEAELDTTKGNPKVRFDPKKWKPRPTQVGKTYSECPVAFLLLLADGSFCIRKVN